MPPIKVFGHQSPDTDATCSAIIWAHYLSEVHELEAKPYVLGEPNTEAKFVLKHFGFETPEVLTALNEGDQVVIVDTNNADELLPGLDKVEILEIIDHHKLSANIKTGYPVDVTIRVLGSTASVMSYLLGDEVNDLADNIKGLMLSCVLSDTLAFRSPTTTAFDKDLAEIIAEQIDVNINDFADKMFAAKSDISHLSDADIIKLDSKKHEQNGKKMRVSVVETTNPKSILDRKADLIKAMDQISENEDLDFILFFAVDILKEEATVFIPNDEIKKIIEESFNVTVTSDRCVLPGVVSRKTQIFPVLKV